MNAMSISKPKLVVRRGPNPDHVYTLTSAIVVIGRDPVSDVVVSDPEVSRRHARIFLQEGSFHIEDLRSTNGTYVNGRRINDRTRLASGDILDFGETVRVIFEHDIAPTGQNAAAGEAEGEAFDLDQAAALMETVTPFPGDRATSRPMRPTVMHKLADAETGESGGSGPNAFQEQAPALAGIRPAASKSRFILLGIGFFLVVLLSCLALFTYLNSVYPNLFSG